MDQIKYILLLISLVGLFNRCSFNSEFPLEKDYPVVETNNPSEIDETGVTFSAAGLSRRLTGRPRET